MKSIAIISPIEDICEKSRQIISEEGLDNISVHLGVLEKSIDLCRQLIQDGIEILISRGDTYMILKEYFNIPIVEIKVGPLDILNSISKIKTPGNIGVVGSKNNLRSLEGLRPFVNRELIKIEVSYDNAEDIILDYRKRDISTFVGDYFVKTAVENINCESALITSGEDSIRDAILESQRILEMTHKIRKEFLEKKSIINTARDGIIAVDNQNKITEFNRSAEKILGINKKDVLSKKIETIFPESKFEEVIKTKQSILGEVTNFFGIKVFNNRSPILLNGECIGAVATFQKISDVQKNEYSIRKQMHKKGLYAKYQFDDIIYKSESMTKVIEIAKNYAGYNAPIFICGNTGTGKELFCQSIHNYSERKEQPFVAINCASIPPQLIESELFGYGGGSFTGAMKEGKQGVFELSHQGTLFLDEVTEIPLRLQSRLLRVLQEKEIMKVGGDRIIPIDVRIIAASNKNLKEEVARGRFREDLYYRINVLELKLPNLNVRGKDIILLAEHFVEKYSKKFNAAPIEISKETETRLLNHPFNGNVRQLENLIQRAVIFGSFDDIFYDYEEHSLATQSLSNYTDDYIRKIYMKNDKNINNTCTELQISRSTLWRKLKNDSTP